MSEKENHMDEYLMSTGRHNQPPYQGPGDV